MIQLKELSIEDAWDLVRWVRDGDRDDLYQWAGPGYTFPLTLTQLEERMAMGQGSKGLTLYGVYSSGSHKCIGTVELTLDQSRPKVGSLGRLYLEKASRGKGYCGHILKAVCQEFFEGLGGDQLFLKVFHFNEVAIRCYEKSGFKKVQYEENVYQSQGGPWHRYYMQLRKEQWIG